MNIQGENKSKNIFYGLLPLWVVIGFFMIGPLLIMAVVSFLLPLAAVILPMIFVLAVTIIVWKWKPS